MSSEPLITLRNTRFPSKRAEPASGVGEWESFKPQRQLCKDGFLRFCELGRTSASANEWRSSNHPSTKRALLEKILAAFFRKSSTALATEEYFGLLHCLPARLGRHVCTDEGGILISRSRMHMHR
mmetsp:Transcript_18307/g.58313  ORF Transcript_18307/g.58313 Transcript_18307/m.58313 type:complete len:125 (-) Transcript_18307:328-702(-)